MNDRYPAAGLASLVAAQGRGEDKTLVHMTPEEVRNLVAIARAQGIEPPINPMTGMLEAGWLSDLLKSIGRGVTTVGRTILQNPQTTALLAGTAYGAIKGDLQKGLEAGMKAYVGTKLLGGIQTGMQQQGRKIPGIAGPTGYKEAGRGADDFGEIAPGLMDVKPTVEAPLGRSPATGGLDALLGRVLGGGQTGTAQQGQAPQGQQGLFRSGDPIMDAIMLYATKKAEQKLTGQRPGIPTPEPVQYRNVQFSRGQVNPRFGEPGQPYFIGGGYTDQGTTTQYPDYTRPPPVTPPQTQTQMPGQQYQQPPPTAPPRSEPLSGLGDRRYAMAGGGIVPRPNPSYPMSRVQPVGYEPETNVFTGEEGFAEGGISETASNLDLESEEERRRKYFENLRPFAPALSDYYRTGAISTGSEQGDNLNRDPLTRLPQVPPGGIASPDLADWYRSLLVPPTGRAPVNMGDYFSTSPRRGTTNYGPVVTYPEDVPPPPPPPPPPPKTCEEGFVYIAARILAGLDPCAKECSPGTKPDALGFCIPDVKTCADGSLPDAEGNCVGNKCPDGSIPDEIYGCDKPKRCADGSPPDEMGRCKSNKCPDGSDPDPVYGCDKPKTCPDGSMPDINGNCPTTGKCPDGSDPDPVYGCDKPKLCPDGSKPDINGNCPTTGKCPDGSDPDPVYGCDKPRRCADGSLPDADGSCPEDRKCPDGSDPDPVYGCDKPRRCADGSLPNEKGECPEDNLCPDGSPKDPVYGCDRSRRCSDGSLPDANGFCPEDLCPDGKPRDPVTAVIGRDGVQMDHSRMPMDSVRKTYAQTVSPKIQSTGAIGRDYVQMAHSRIQTDSVRKTYAQTVSQKILFTDAIGPQSAPVLTGLSRMRWAFAATASV